MRKTDIAKKLKAMGAHAVPSLENATDDSIIPAKPVEQLPTDLPYAKEVDHSDETGVTMYDVEPVELYEELEEAIADVALNIKSIEALTVVSNLSGKNLSNAALEDFVRSTVGMESGTRLLGSTSTGGIQCTADIISLEETAGNAAQAGWENVYRKVMGIISKTEKISETTEETAKRIQEDFRAIKKSVFAYRGGSSINIGVMSNGDSNLNTVIANTRQAILEDLSGKASAGLDKAINDLTAKTATVLTSKKGTMADVMAKSTKDADSLSSTYKIKEPEFVILGFTRRNLDDQLHLPQGTFSLLTGGVYNYPRYSPNKQTKPVEIELKPNNAKDLYSIGMNIGNEIAEQARLWPQRVEALKAIAEMAKSQSREVDGDRNTWAAEQTGSRNTVKMWNTNASARKHYINVFNKVAGEILEVLKHVSGATTTETSQEFFGMGKPKALTVEQAVNYIRTNSGKFTGGAVTADTSMLGGGSDAQSIVKHINYVIATTTHLIDMAVKPFADVYKAIGQFEDDDDEDVMDAVIVKSMTPLLKYLTKPLVINGYEARAVKYKSGGAGLEGTFDKPAINNSEVTLDSKTLVDLLSKVSQLDATKALTRKLPWLDYAQEYCDWIYPLTQLLNATRDQLLELGLKAVGSNATLSTEAFGGFFSKKPKEEPVNATAAVPMHTVDFEKYVKSTAFAGFKENYTVELTAYNDDLKQNNAAMAKACNEIGRSFNESNINKYVDDLNKMINVIYADYVAKHPEPEDWRTTGNNILELITTELYNSKLFTKHFGMNYSNREYATQFDYAPNFLISSRGTENLENKRLTKRLVSGFTKDTALQFMSAMKLIDEIELPSKLDQNDFLRNHPRYDDSLYITAIEPLFDVTARLFEIMDETYLAIRNGVNI